MNLKNFQKNYFDQKEKEKFFDNLSLEFNYDNNDIKAIDLR